MAKSDVFTTDDNVKVEVRPVIRNNKRYFYAFNRDNGYILSLTKANKNINSLAKASKIIKRKGSFREGVTNKKLGKSDQVKIIQTSYEKKVIKRSDYSRKKYAVFVRIRVREKGSSWEVTASSEFKNWDSYKKARQQAINNALGQVNQIYYKDIPEDLEYEIIDEYLRRLR